jgi:hypothetical protein
MSNKDNRVNSNPATKEENSSWNNKSKEERLERLEDIVEESTTRNNTRGNRS